MFFRDFLSIYGNKFAGNLPKVLNLRNIIALSAQTIVLPLIMLSIFLVFSACTPIFIAPKGSIEIINTKEDDAAPSISPDHRT